MRARTDAASEQTTAKAAKTGQAQGESKKSEDVGQPAAGQDAGDADAAVSADAQADENAGSAQPAKAKPRTSRPRARARGAASPRQGLPARAPGKTETKSADAQADENAGSAEPAKAKPRTSRPRARARGAASPRQGLPARAPGKTETKSADADDPSDASNEESIEGEATASSDATATARDDDDSALEVAAFDEANAEAEAEGDGPTKAKRRISWSRVLAYGVLPALTLLLVPVAGYLKWQDSVARGSQLARIESVAAAKDSTIALLSYKSDSVDKDLEAAKTRLTGTFKESYSQLINDVVIPGAKRAHISTTATVPAAALVSATPDHAVTLLFVNQTAVVGTEPPSDTTSSVRVTMDKVGGRWLISGFDPV